MSLVVTLAVTAAVIVVLARWTASRQKGPPRQSVNSAIRRLSERHRDTPGLIVDIYWPLSWIYALKRTTEVVLIYEKTFLGEVHRLACHITSRRRPVWVPLVGGGKRHFRCVATGEVESTTHLTIDIGHRGHALLTCWPAKRGVLTPARQRTAWAIELLDQDNC